MGINVTFIVTTSVGQTKVINTAGFNQVNINMVAKKFCGIPLCYNAPTINR